MNKQNHNDISNETLNKRRFHLRKWHVALIVLGLLLLFGIYFFGVRINLYAGPVTIERVVLNNKIDTTATESKNTFHNRETVYCLVWTSGVDTVINIRWYYENKLLAQFAERTRENYIGFLLQPPLQVGKYRADISLSDGKPLRSINFNVTRFQPQVIPPQPTPAGHVDFENDKLLVSVPFAFDETWSINGTDWKINEVKVVFLQDSVVVAVVTKFDADLTLLSEQELRTISLPIALYAWQHGYIDTAKSLQVDGQKQQFKNMFVTLFNPQTGKIWRTAFEFNELK